MAEPGLVTLRTGTAEDIPGLRALGEAVVPPTYGPIDAAYAQRMLDGEVVAMANLGRLAASYRDFPHVTGDREVMWKLNEQAYCFYQAHGFEEVERVSDDGPFPDDVWMRKDLLR